MNKTKALFFRISILLIGGIVFFSCEKYGRLIEIETETEEIPE